MTTASSLLGAAGEHYVMYRLLRRGLIGALAPEGVPTIDILVSSPDGQRLSALQVKTTTEAGQYNGWFLSKKHETIEDDNLFYVFVQLPNNSEKNPSAHIIPSSVVAKAAKTSHAAWLAGKEGRKDSNMRRLLPDYSRIFEAEDHPLSFGWLDQYFENWDQIERC